MHPAAKPLGLRKPTKPRERLGISRSVFNRVLGGDWGELRTKPLLQGAIHNTMRPLDSATINSRTGFLLGGDEQNADELYRPRGNEEEEAERIRARARAPEHSRGVEYLCHEDKSRTR